ncbi:uncharacterized protein [Triticum aestivum]|uniref:uncharacterized protein n=1 Tax=Triticum aestivum TaxID=4565 RepID=UPI001D017879|nr:uncharacterized protein LOC123159942 [Triticum aestivum]
MEVDEKYKIKKELLLLARQVFTDRSEAGLLTRCYRRCEPASQLYPYPLFLKSIKSGKGTACPRGRGEAAHRRSLESRTSSALFLGAGSAVPSCCCPVRKGPPWRSLRRATLRRAPPSDVQRAKHTPVRLLLLHTPGDAKNREAGEATLHHVILQELDWPLIDKIDRKVDKANTELRKTNVRLKETVNQARGVGSLRSIMKNFHSFVLPLTNKYGSCAVSTTNFTVDIILICIILGIGAWKSIELRHGHYNSCQCSPELDV